MKSKTGWIILLAGLLCMMAALAVFLFNQNESHQAKTASAKIVAALSEQIAEEGEENHEETFPTDITDRTMPEMTVDGERYAGILRIPELELELPVLAFFDYDSLQVTPCLYSGTIYRRNMVIGAQRKRRTRATGISRFLRATTRARSASPSGAKWNRIQ